MASDKNLTFSRQEELKKLPLPDINNVIDDFVSHISPLLAEPEVASTKLSLENMISSPSFQKVSERLKTRHEETENYIDEFWLNSYLGSKAPLPVNVNPMFVLEDDPTPSRNNQLERASSLIVSSLKFIAALRHGRLEPDTQRGTPLCMSQFNVLFGSARIPSEDGYDKIITSQESKHIVLIRNEHFYYFQGLDEDFECQLTLGEVRRNIATVVKHSEKHKFSSSVNNNLGVLTCLGRKKWGEMRSYLESNETNKEILKIIDSALFLVCLDEVDCVEGNKIAKNILHGSFGASDQTQKFFCARWYDKLQIIVMENGSAGVNFEHSVTDGHTVLRYASDVFTDTIVRFAQAISGPSRIHSFMRGNSTKLSAKVVRKRDTTAVRVLEFEKDERIEREIRYGSNKMGDVIKKLDLEVLEFPGYGKQFIVENGMSPDAFVQIAIQAAYFKIYGELVNTYESVITKQFLKGRTEAMRTVSPEVQGFVDSLVSATDSSEQKVEKLRNALKVHSTNTKKCASGKSFDRLFFAIKCMYELDDDLTLPEFFTSPGYAILQENILSTSNCGNPSLRMFGFGPVCQNGFGIGYIIKPESMNFCITSFGRQTALLAQSLREYFEEIQTLLLELDPKDFEQFMLESARDNNDGYTFFGDSEENQLPPVKLFGKRIG